VINKNLKLYNSTLHNANRSIVVAKYFEGIKFRGNYRGIIKKIMASFAKFTFLRGI